MRLYERKVDVPRFKVLKNRLYCKRDKVSRISKFAYWDVFVRRRRSVCSKIRAAEQYFLMGDINMAGSSLEGILCFEIGLYNETTTPSHN